MNSSKGFTIIEIVISIFILSFAVVGIFSAFSVVVILTSDSADQLTATYLAQEGMEIVRNIRDTNWLNMDAPGGSDDVYGSDDNFYFQDCGKTGCEIDYTTTGSVSNPVKPYSSADYLNIDKDGFYRDSAGGAPTKFERKIIVTPITDIGEILDPNKRHIIKVTVQVSWDEKANILNSGYLANDCEAGKNCIITEETLYDWYNYVNH